MTQTNDEIKSELREIASECHVGFPIIMQDGVGVPYEPVEEMWDKITSYITEMVEGELERFAMALFDYDEIEQAYDIKQDATNFYTIQELVKKYILGKQYLLKRTQEHI